MSEIPVDLGNLVFRMETGGEHWDVVNLPAIAESEIENGQLRIENEDSEPASDNSQFSILNFPPTLWDAPFAA